MLDSLTITILFIFATAMLGAFTRRVKRDKCLYDFNNDPITLEKITGKVSAKGILKVESTGMEFIYPEPLKSSSKNLLQRSYIFYKYEYDQIRTLIRFHNELSVDGKNTREKELKKTYQPSFIRRTKRKIQNFFKTINDSLKEVGNVIVTHFQKGSGSAAIIKSQDKYLKQINQELIESVGSAYDPILERYIGHKIVFDLIKNDKILSYQGILKDYTTNYLEILDVAYDLEDKEPQKADIIVPQKIGIVRHLSEDEMEHSIISLSGIKKWIKND